jgi:hypothetical protein
MGHRQSLRWRIEVYMNVETRYAGLGEIGAILSFCLD